MATNDPVRDGGGRRFSPPEAGRERVVVVGGGQTGRRLTQQLASHRQVHHVDESATDVTKGQEPG